MSGVGGLCAHVVVRFPSLEIDVRVAAAPGEVVALVGPNGAGKTTVLRALAGLQPLDAGRMELRGVVLDDPLARIFELPPARRVGYVFQDYRLFPHLSALDNVAFGLQSRGARRRDARVTAAHWLEQMGLADVAARYPAALSGGQAQRVALARALAVDPALLLLDEPLAAVDEAARVEVHAVLARYLAGFGGATLLVTHDRSDAQALADRVVELDRGRVVRYGTAASDGPSTA